MASTSASGVLNGLKNESATKDTKASTHPARYLRWGLRFLVIFIDILITCGSHSLVLFALKPVFVRLLGWGDLFWRIEGYLFERVLRHVATWIHTAGYRVCLHGDEIAPEVREGRTLVISNHISTGDVPSLFYLWATVDPSPTPGLWWVMDILFKWTPFGWVSQVHRDHFIRQGKETRHGTIEKFSQSVQEDYLKLPRKWCVIFPEGGFHWKRIAASNRFAEKNGLPPMDHVTYPRVGAVYAFADTLAKAGGGQGLDYIIDMTIGYADNNPFGLDDVVFGWRDRPSTVHIHQRVYSVAKDAVPVGSSEELLQWLYRRWQEKNQQLDAFYRTGEFDNTPHRETKWNWPGILFAYLIAFVEGYLVYRVACFPLWLVFG